MSLGEEFGKMTPLMEKMVKLSIKYQADIASMSMKQVKNILTRADWIELSLFMKTGGRNVQSIH